MPREFHMVTGIDGRDYEALDHPLMNMLAVADARVHEAAVRAIVGDPEDLPSTMNRAEIDRVFADHDAFMREHPPTCPCTACKPPADASAYNWCQGCDRVCKQECMLWTIDGRFLCIDCAGPAGGRPPLWVSPWTTEGCDHWDN
jgi:hypothetical protein